MSVLQQLSRLMGERMAAPGRMAMIETTGRRSGRAIRAPAGYIRNDNGEVWLGAGSAEAHWPRNLIASPWCRVRIADSELEYLAYELLGSERIRAVAAIQRKYGAPAARVGTGPVFVLRPVASFDAAGRDRTLDGSDGTAVDGGTEDEVEAVA